MRCKALAEQGFIAATAGLEEQDNPFPEGTAQHAEWLRSYAEGVAADGEGGADR